MEVNDIQLIKENQDNISSDVNFIDDTFMIFDDVNNFPINKFSEQIHTIIVAVCLKGHLKININLKEYDVSPNTLMVLLPNQTVKVGEKTEDFTGFLIGLSRSFIDESLPGTKKILNAFFYVRKSPCTVITPSELECLKEYHSLIRKKIQTVDLSYKKDIVQSLSHVIFYELCNIFDKHQEIIDRISSRKDDIFRQFISLLTENFKSARTISFYADHLCMSAKYLSIIVKKASGKTAAEWIEEYVILEAKTLLKSTTLTIQEISDRLNFANQSFFGKYFKHYTGMSPKAYRNKK